MKSPIRFRLVALGSAVLLAGAFLFLVTLESRRRAEELRHRLRQMNSESLGIAEDFRRNLRELNNTVFNYGVSRQPAQWQLFLDASRKLDLWIDEQKPKLETALEKEVLQQIDKAYDEFRSAARKLHDKVQASGQQQTPLSDFAEFQSQSQRLFASAWSLADALRARRGQLVSDARERAESLRQLQLASLGLLFVFGLGLTAFVYRDMIAPLRTKLVESQALVERQEKLASLGMLAAGVAHEIRNPLTAIKAAVFMQQRKSQPASRERSDAEIMMREIVRLERIVSDFLQFARPGEPELAPLSAQSPLKEVQLLLAPALSELQIQVVVQPSAPLQVKADPDQIKQVLINLVQNAADSIEREGTITLRTRADRQRLAGRETDVVIIEVADTGKGIPPEVEKRLFDPFFTTKDNGTGLGLSIAARIVHEHGGALQYQTQLNVGTTFGIVLPRLTE